MTDNSAENLILESIHYYRSKLKNQKEISQVIVKSFHTTLLDIEANPYQWITQIAYNDFLSQIETKQPEGNAMFVPANRRLNELAFQRCLYLNYGEVDVSTNSYKNLFHILLKIWLIGITNDPIKKKLQYIKRIILKVSTINSYVNLGKFLKTYLDIFLIEITQNYSRSEAMNKENRSEINQLVVSIYSAENVDDFHKYLLKKLKGMICLRKSQLRSENIDNEFLSDDIFNKFFEDNDYIVDPIELRITFYNKYSARMQYYMK